MLISRQGASCGENAHTDFYYGVQGKRDCVTRFLTDLTEHKKISTLLLYSDEAMDWILGDPVFTRTWSLMMIRYLSMGGKIKIIHSLGRNSDEMYEAVNKWMPIYMSGRVEAFYYPKLRDGVFHRTMFIAEGYCAIVSQSVSGQKEDELNSLIQDKKAVETISSEFYTYLSMCKKLMKIVTTNDKAQIAEIVQAFCSTEGNAAAMYTGNIAVCVKELALGLVIKTDSPYSVFIIREERMIAALEGYLKNCGIQITEESSRNTMDLIREMFAY